MMKIRKALPSLSALAVIVLLTTTSYAFKIKMHREAGYSWSGDWCFECKNGPGTCTADTGNELVIIDCQQAQLQFRFEDSGEGGLIKVVAETNSGDLCLQVMPWWGVTQLKSCSSNSGQLFSAGQGNFAQGPFELVGYKGDCLSQTGEPDAGERLYSMECDTAARTWETSLFVKEVSSPPMPTDSPTSSATTVSPTTPNPSASPSKAPSPQPAVSPTTPYPSVSPVTNEPSSRAPTLNPTPTLPTATSYSFKIKMHREAGYSWSGDWCFECKNGPGTCTADTGNELVIIDCQQAQLQFRFEDSGEGGLIKVVAETNSGDLCLQVMPWWGVTQLKSCSSNSGQLFSAGQGNFAQGPFELVGYKGDCLSQTGEPDAGERLYSMECDTAARTWETSLFVKEVSSPPMPTDSPTSSATTASPTGSLTPRQTQSPSAPPATPVPTPSVETCQYGTENLALGKPTSQSTTDAYGGVSSRAVDGNTSPNYWGGSVTHTDECGNPQWWMVDLGEDAKIEIVTLYNRMDDWVQGRLSGATVELLLDDGETVAWTSAPIGDTEGVARIDIPISYVVARYVRVALSSGEPLSLAEVEVFGCLVNTEPPESFKLKMLWEQGYPWEEGSWCAECEGGPDACGVDVKLEIIDCAQAQTHFRLTDSGNNGRVHLVADTRKGVFCLETMVAGEAFLKYCNAEEIRQQYLPGRGNFFQGDRFELVAWNFKCISQVYLPDPNEKLFSMKCSAAATSGTNLFTKEGLITSPPSPTLSPKPSPAPTTALPTAPPNTVPRPEGPPPNILLIFADDVGTGQVPGYWSDPAVPQPNIQKLIDKGVLFTDMHSTPRCGTSRYVLLSGNYQHRGTYWSGSYSFKQDPMFRSGQQSIAQALRDSPANYHTAMMGKWHMGGDIKPNGIFGDDNTALSEERHDWTLPFGGGPQDIGFDSSLISFSGIQDPPYAFFRDGKLTFDPRTENVTYWTAGSHAMPYGESGMYTEGEGDSTWDSTAYNMILVNETARFIDDHEAGDRKDDPFFAYVALGQVHSPFTPPDHFYFENFSAPVKGVNPSYQMDMLTELDYVVESLMKTLEDRNLLNDTIVIFTSDNGGEHLNWPMLCCGQTPSGPLRGQKSEVWEGGHRVPFIIRHDGVLPPGAKRNGVLGINDIYSTMCDIAGVPVPSGHAIDSVSFADHLFSGSDYYGPRDYLAVWAHNGFGARRGDSIRKGKYKFVRDIEQAPSAGKYLYDLENDVAEQWDLSGDPQYAALMEEMEAKLDEIMNSEQAGYTSSA